MASPVKKTIHPAEEQARVAKEIDTTVRRSLVRGT
jgi:hypothetical protein